MKLNKCGTKRRGACVAEFAICLPLIALLVFASMESANMIFLAHSLNVVGYEGARLAIEPDATNDTVLQRCNEVLADYQVVGATVTTNPVVVHTASRGQSITVTVAAPCDDNSVMRPWFFGGDTLSANVTMVKE